MTKALSRIFNLCDCFDFALSLWSRDASQCPSTGLRGPWLQIHLALGQESVVFQPRPTSLIILAKCSRSCES